MAAAHVREACGIPGTSVRTAFLCRDKPAMKEALRAGGRAVRRSRPAARIGDEIRAFAERGRLPADRQAARRRRRVGHRRVRQRRPSSTRRSLAAASSTGAASRSRSSSRATRASTTRSRVDGSVVARLRLALLPERARGDADALDLAAVHRHQPHRRAPSYDEVKAMGQKVDQCARHRHLGDAHGVVLRSEGR